MGKKQEKTYMDFDAVVMANKIVDLKVGERMILGFTIQNPKGRMRFCIGRIE